MPKFYSLIFAILLIGSSSFSKVKENSTIEICKVYKFIGTLSDDETKPPVLSTYGKNGIPLMLELSPKDTTGSSMLALKGKLVEATVLITKEEWSRRYDGSLLEIKLSGPVGLGEGTGNPIATFVKSEPNCKPKK